MLLSANSPTRLFFFFFFNDTATTEIYTLSLHDALPIYTDVRKAAVECGIQRVELRALRVHCVGTASPGPGQVDEIDRKSTRLNSSHLVISYAVFCLKKKNNSRDRKLQHCVLLCSSPARE